MKYPRFYPAVSVILLAVVAARAASEESLNVFASDVARPVTIRSGFSHGFQPPYTVDSDAVAALLPQHWRVTKYDNILEAREQGARITYVISDSFVNSRGGYPVVNPWEDWRDWETYVGDIVQWFADAGIDVDYWDIWNEPDHPDFWHGTYEQSLELFARAIRVIRGIDSEARIVGPSVSWFRPGQGGEEDVVQFLIDLDTQFGERFDAVAWHENGGAFHGGPRPEHIYINTLTIRDGIANAFPPDYRPELHVNEYSGAQEHLSPGWSVGYLFWLEVAEVDASMRACWNVYSIGESRVEHWSDCWAGLNGLFMLDGEMKQASYWVFHEHAATVGADILSMEISDATTVGLATRHDHPREIRIMASRYWKQGPGDVRISLQDYPYSATDVIVEVRRLANDVRFYDEPPLAKALAEGPSLLWRRRQPVVDGSVEILLEAAADGDAFFIRVNEAPGITTQSISISPPPPPAPR